MKIPISLLTRRGFLVSSCATIGAGTLRAATPSCTLMPEQEEGPYYVQSAAIRSDLTEEKEGLPLRLQIMVMDSKKCAPLQNAAVDIWHCDAVGVYSGFTANGGGNDMGRGPGFGPPPRGDRGKGLGPPPGGRGRGGRGAIDETRFLRGVQVTSDQGLTEFATIYPGWYAGRTIHIHLKVHIGGHVSHTGQLFLPEDITAEIAKLEPYKRHESVHRTLHTEDHIFLGQGGSQSMVKLERLQKGSNAGGFVATIALAVDPEATPAVF